MTSCSLQEVNWPQLQPTRSRVFSHRAIASGNEKAEFLEEQLQNVLSVTYQGSDISEPSYIHPKPLEKRDEIEIDTDFEFGFGNVNFAGAYDVADAAKKPKILSISPKCEVGQLPKINKYYKHDANLREYFVHHFKLCKPNLTLILPSTNNLAPENAIKARDPNYMKNFLADMRQIIRNTDTWLLTNGLNWGLTRVIGESIATRVLSPFTSETVELIGIQKFEKLPPTVRNCISRLAMNEQLEEDTIPRGCLEENHSLFLSMKDNLNRDEIETFWDTIQHTMIIKRIEEIRAATRRESIVQDLEQKWGKGQQKTSSFELSTRNSQVSMTSPPKQEKDTIELEEIEKVKFVAPSDDEPTFVDRELEKGPRIPSEYQNLWFKQIEFKDPDINPAVCLLLDNSLDGMRHVLHAIQNRVPTVLVIGSGIAADTVHQILLFSRDPEVTSVINEVREFLQRNYPSHLSKLPKDLLSKLVTAVVTNEELFTFYHPLRHGIHELSKAILLALLKGYQGNNKRLYGLILSFRWKRPSLALEQIFIGREKWISGDDTRAVQRIFFSALSNNNTGFVHRMLESKIIDFKFFGNMYYMSQLYKRTFDRLSDSEGDIIANKMVRIHFSNCRPKKDPRYILIEVGKLIEALMGHDYVSFYKYLPISRKNRNFEEANIKKNVNNCYNFVRHLGAMAKQGLKRFRISKISAKTKKHKLARAEKAQRLFEQFPEEQLFIWCVFFHRWEMAILILKYCTKTCLVTLLAASRLIRGMKLKYLARTDVDEIARDRLDNQASFFENLATTLLGEFSYSSQNDLKLKLLLKNRHVETKEQLMGLEVAAYEPDKPSMERDEMLMRDQDETTTYIWPWHENNAFDMAIKGDCKHFIAHPLIQDYANQKWYANIRRLNKEYKVILCFFIPFLIPFVLELHTRRKRLEHHINPHNDPVTKETYFRQKSFFHFFLFLFYDYFRTIYNFYNAPKIKYWLHFLSHLIYTILFTIVGVTPYRPIRNRSAQCICQDPLLIIEIFVWVWTFSLIMEEFSQLLHEKGSLFLRIRGYISSAWNILDVGLMVLFVVAFGVKLGCDCADWVHRIYALIILILYVRIFQYLIMSAYFGVIVLTIFALGEEVVYFVFVLLLSMIGFGAAMQAVVASDALYENFQAQILLFTIFFRPYWQLFGEFFLGQLGTDLSSGREVVTRNLTTMVSFFSDSSNNSNQTMDTCVSQSSLQTSSSLLEFDYTRRPLPYLILALWLIFSNVLLINLLIAKFNNIYLSVEAKSSILWKFNRYSAIEEFRLKPTFPPPLVILSHLRKLLKYLYGKCLLRILRRKVYKEKVDNFHKKNVERWKWTKDIQKDGLDRWERKRLSEQEESVKNLLSNVETKLEDVYRNCHTLLDHMGSDEPLLTMMNNEIREVRRQLADFGVH